MRKTSSISKKTEYDKQKKAMKSISKFVNAKYQKTSKRQNKDNKISRY